MSAGDAQGLQPLTRAYGRDPAVEGQIVEALRGAPEGLARRAALPADAADGLREEAVVGLVRAMVRQGDEHSAWTLIEALTVRVNRTLIGHTWRLLPGSRDGREELRDDIVKGLYVVWHSLEPAHEFWEVRFGLCLKRFIMDTAKRHRLVGQREVHPEPRGGMEDEAPDPYPSEFPDPNAADPFQGALLATALMAIPEPYRLAFYLRRHEQWDAESIAAHMKVTSRTVRNYLRRADDALRTWRGGETGTA